MGLDQCLVKVSWFRGLMPVFWWIELDLVPLKGSSRSNSVFSGIYGLGMALGSLCANVWGCVPVLLKVWCEVSSTGACLSWGEAWS